MELRYILITCILCCVGAKPTVADKVTSPGDLVITNAKIWTGDPQRATGNALVIFKDRIVRICDFRSAQDFVSENTKVIDARGRRVIPGLVDCHAHLIGGGLTLTQLQLREVASKENFVQRVEKWVTDNPITDSQESGVWIRGRGWSIESWRDPQEPSKEWIDPVTGDRPAFLRRMDGHQALANSKALRLAGISKGTPDPVGGQIVRSPQTGEPTGILKDAAMDLVSDLMPEPTSEQMHAALTEAMKLFNRHGVTMVHDMSNPEHGKVLSKAARDGKLSLRVYSFCQTDDWTSNSWSDIQDQGDWWKSAGCKAYLDGSLGSRTAYMRLPYSDNEVGKLEWRGLLMDFAQPQKAKSRDMFHQFLFAAQRGFQPAIHSIGDEANHLLLETYAKVRDQLPPTQLGVFRPRIEHAQHLLPEDIDRFSKIGVIASMQPLHKADDGRYAEKRIGSQRCQTSYAYRSLLDSGTRVCFGSDWPVVSNNPMLGIQAAVTGRTLDGKIFVPQQNITVEQALQCYTANAAYACFKENRLGVIKSGYLADIVILDQDILNIPPEKIGSTRVDLTIVNGRIVWQREMTAKNQQQN